MIKSKKKKKAIYEREMFFECRALTARALGAQNGEGREERHQKQLVALPGAAPHLGGAATQDTGWGSH